MIFPVVFIALFMCTGAEVQRIISECEDFACFAPDKCIGRNDGILYSIHEGQKLIENCQGILMIKPSPDKKWLVVLESWHPSTTTLTLKQDSNELFTCKKTSSGSEAKSMITSSTVQEQPPINLSYINTAFLSCQFLIGVGTMEVVQRMNQQIALVSDVTLSKRIDTDFLSSVERKMRCQFTHILFEPATSPEDAVEPAQAKLATVVCTDPLFKLQYKSGSDYEDVAGTGISCQYDLSNRKYYYQIETKKSGKTKPPGPFHARCYAKVCALCRYPLTTPAGKNAPSSGNYVDGCMNLTCPKFFKVGGEESLDKAVCTKNKEGEFKWIVGDKTVDNTTEVECVEQMPCKQKLSGCTGDCKLNATTNIPYCPATHSLSVIIDEKERLSITSIECDTSNGTLFYKTEANPSLPGYLPYEPSGVSFNCSLIENPAAAFYHTTWFHKTMTGGAGIAGVLTVLIIIYMIWEIPRLRRQLIAQDRGETTKK